MLTQSYLFNRDGTDDVLGNSTVSLIPSFLRSLRLVVPRQSCVYSRISCAGVPLLGIKGFASLQAEQLSPFQKFGVYAVKQGETLHMWTWDKTLEIHFADRHGRAATQVVPYSLLAPRREQGVSWIKTNGHPGVEAQLWRNKQCVDTLLFEQQPGPTEWSAYITGQPQLGVLGWPIALPPLPNVQNGLPTIKPWGRNLLSAAFRLPKIKFALIAKFALWVSTAALAASTAAWLSERHAHQKAIAEGVENQKLRLAALEPVQRNREATQEVVKWLTAAKNLAPRPSKLEILNEMATVITRQGLVVRELDFSPPTISATLVPVRSSDVRLTAVIGALEANPLFHDVRFVDVVGGNAFKFTWRLKNNAPLLAPSALGTGIRP